MVKKSTERRGAKRREEKISCRRVQREEKRRERSEE